MRSQVVSQAPAPTKINFNKITETTFPAILVSGNERTKTRLTTIDTPMELSKYCSIQAQRNISKAQSNFAAGITLQIVGGAIYGGTDKYGYGPLIGVLMVAGGTVFEMVSIGNLIGHVKWDYRRKQVDMYLTPAGATIKF